MASTIKLKNGSGAPTSGQLVQGEPALDLTNKRLYTENASGTVIEVGTNPSSLTIGGTALTATAAELNTLDGITATTAELNTLDGITATVTELNYTDGVTSNIQTQLNTKAPIASPTFTGTVTAPAVNVNGTVTADGLTVDGNINLGYVDGRRSAFISNNTTRAGSVLDLGNRALNIFSTTGDFGGTIKFSTRNATGTSDTDYGLERLRIASSGDISFYEDTGTTAKFFWDASAEALAIGHTVTSHALSLANTKELAFLDNTGASRATLTIDASNYIQMGGAAGGLAGYKFDLNGSNAVTIDGSRRVGIGTTSPATALNISGSTTGSIAPTIRISNTLNSGDWAAVTDDMGRLEFYSDDTSGNAPYTTAFISVRNDFVAGTPTLPSGALVFGTTTYDNASGAVERMRIDSSGNVGIGTTSPAQLLHLRSATPAIEFDDSAFATVRGRIYSDEGNLLLEADYNNSRNSSNIAFNVDGSERMRIDSSGNLLVGTTASTLNLATSSGAHLGVAVDAVNDIVIATRASGHGLIVNRTGTDGDIAQFRKDGTTVGSISVTASTTSYNITSDQRLKENITDAPAGNVDDIKVRSFDWKADGSHQEYGMVAQELEAVAPYAVTKGETEDDMWSVDYSKLVPMLIKEIQDLKAEVAALKGA